MIPKRTPKPWKDKDYRKKVAYKLKTNPNPQQQAEYKDKKIASKFVAKEEWYADRGLPKEGMTDRKSRKDYFSKSRAQDTSVSIAPEEVPGVKDYMPWNE